MTDGGKIALLILILLIVMWVGSIGNTIQNRNILKSGNTKEILKKVGYLWIATILSTILLLPDLF